MSVGCRHCRDGIEHCHGAVIRHLTMRSECTEDGCTSPESVVHVFAVDCGAVGCLCAQDGVSRQPMGSADSRAS